MKKNILLSFCLLCASSISACSSVSDETTYIPVEEDTQVIDTTVKPNDKCGVDGIGCNDTALINYTKTEADYRAYGERTKRDHLYTQASAGNNITATVRPGIEEDIVTEHEEDSYAEDENFSPNGDLFMQTAANDITPQNTGSTSPIYPDQVGHNGNIEMYSYPGYEITCQGDCSGFAMDDSSITSEFTEESFDRVSEEMREIDPGEICPEWILASAPFAESFRKCGTVPAPCLLPAENPSLKSPRRTP